MPSDPTKSTSRPARALIAGALALALGGGSARADPRPPPEVKRPLGLWVLAEGSQRVLENPERIPALLRDARELGATDLFVQVVRRGVTWWPSTVARPAEGWAAARAATPGAPDPLARLLAEAQGQGLKVHAWVNLLSLGSNAEAPILTTLGNDVLQVDRKGRSILDYPDRRVPEPDAAFLRMGTPALWIDPAAPGVAAWQRQLVAELFALYPTLDGLHLDHARYPDVLPFTPGSRFAVGLDFGYGEATRARFQAATNLTAPLGDETANAEAWDTWRRDELTALVASLGEAVRDVSPGVAVSAAVFAWQNRAYLSLYQDWYGWLEAGLLEFAVPMLYTRDPRLLRYQAAAFAGGVAGERVWTGLGSWLFRRRPEGAVAQLREVDRLGVAGRAFFSWDSIAEAPKLRKALIEEAKRASREATRAPRP